ncbi:MAG: Zn-ribbon domain-containing OB-fold protein [Candidatus Dadabacteria bacterium]|nr:MAG: Zn-ribbon domain-containing OB-fold protein [Candidatus Dadabacteria bacterium]
MNATYGKPLPLLEGTTKEFYEHCKQRRLSFQRCTDCGAWRHVPRPMCAKCGSWQWEWAPSSGRGKVFTWTVVRRPMHPAFANDTPYAPVVVELEEGVRMVSWIVDCPPEEIRMGMPVEVVYEDVTPEVTLPMFRRAVG